MTNDGSVDVRIICDHGVIDGATAARALGRMQAEILQEITALNKSAANIAPTIAAGGAATAR